MTIDDGVVTLTGVVTTQAESDKAARLANVTGVSRVNNNLVVTKEVKGTAGKVVEKTKDGAEKVGEKTDGRGEEGRRGDEGRSEQDRRSDHGRLDHLAHAARSSSVRTC